MSEQVIENGAIVILDTEAFISQSADILELYREYAVNEINAGKEDFLGYSDWKELNKEALL